MLLSDNFSRTLYLSCQLTSPLQPSPLTDLSPSLVVSRRPPSRLKKPRAGIYATLQDDIFFTITILLGSMDYVIFRIRDAHLKVQRETFNERH